MVSLVFLFKVNTQIMYLCKVSLMKIKRLKKTKNQKHNFLSNDWTKQQQKPQKSLVYRNESLPSTR